MNNPDISVIIPTYNREKSLEAALGRFSRQSYPADKFEVIVIDDGSSDGTQDKLAQLQREAPYKLRYFKQENRGPASARNKGIKEAAGNIVLFTGDDILPGDDFIKEHLGTHKKHTGIAVLGFVDWDRGIKVTDFMEYLAPDGFQFRYGSIKDGYDCGFRHFYTSNISLEKKWLQQDLFDENFSYPALEDTELAYRLEKRGLKVVLNKNAVGFHQHAISPEEFYRKMKMSGYSAVYFLKKHPELKQILLPANIVFAKIIAALLKLGGFLLKINKKLYWRSRIVISYIDGFAAGMRRDKI